MSDSTPTRSATADEDRSMSLDEIRGVYADQADWVARMAPLDRLFMGRYRRRLFGRAEGRVLDVACGTGTNVPHLPDSVAYVGVDISPEMLAKAAERFDDLELGEDLLEMDAQELDFPDDSFDTVISALSTCTFPDPVAALREMSRVCRPDGRILLLEHGRSDVGAVARFQDWRADAHFEKHGCRWNQEPLAVVSRADLPIREATSRFLGILTAVEARPKR
ncbi:class I SAM-dependent methyltransferase [Halorussus salilacus]|uniref:class I SAM-dependent methyltransferase n=1 Tax=Halorussus salilacus TaxID=2953750 RepID=UPI0020A0FBCA|nr:class I SAM-dependent methyltransferase [Halorussus salilacus]USZ66991.1 class I SAM-dependent methyltransferase [Halorussus salilacus]